MLYDRRNVCEFCGVDHKENCDFEFQNPNTTLNDI